MKIYEVIFTDRRDPDGDTDAIFLVRAEDFRSAVKEVFQNGGRREHCSVLPHSILEIGEESHAGSNSTGTRILRGPYFECALNFGWREWRRKDLETDESEYGSRYDWEEVIRGG